MTPRALIVLAVMAVLSTSAAVWSYRANHQYAVDASIGEPVLPGLVNRINDVATIETKDSHGSIRLERHGKDWVVAGSGYPADAGKLHKILVSLVQLSKLEAKTASPSQYGQLEVGGPGKAGSRGRLVTLYDKNGKTIAAIVLGKLAPGRAGEGKDAEYVRVADQARSWLAVGRVGAASNIVTWVDPTVVSLRVDHVERARIIHPDGEVLEVYRNGTTSAGTPKFDIAGAIPAGKKIKSDIGVRYTATDLANVDFVNVRPVKAGTKEVSRAELQMDDGLKIGYRLTQDNGKFWITVSVLAKGKDAKKADAIAKRTSGWEFQLADYKEKEFNKRLADLLE